MTTPEAPRERSYGRAADQMRPIKLTNDIIKTADGSCLAEFGDTRVPVSYTHLTLPTN